MSARHGEWCHGEKLCARGLANLWGMPPWEWNFGEIQGLKISKFRKFRQSPGKSPLGGEKRCPRVRMTVKHVWGGPKLKIAAISGSRKNPNL